MVSNSYHTNQSFRKSIILVNCYKWIIYTFNLNLLVACVGEVGELCPLSTPSGNEEGNVMLRNVKCCKKELECRKLGGGLKDVDFGVCRQMY